MARTVGHFIFRLWEALLRNKVVFHSVKLRVADRYFTE